MRTVAGQLVVVTFAGHAVTPRLRDLILRGHVAGVLLFRTNFADSTALGALDAQLQAIQAQAQPGVPLLVMLDQEGGRVRHVADAPPLAAAAVEATLGPGAVRASMARTARALRRAGVGIDLAPVADVRTNPNDRVIGDRSYGNSPGAAAPFIAAAVRGLHDGGEGAVLKHFPGLGGAAGDPHVAMPTDHESASDWRRLRLPAFAAGIAAGAEAVMTTALVEPSLDPTGAPAMLSRTMTTALLRDQLGFGGVIMTDSLAMDGLKPYGSLPQLTVKAVQAGADMVLLGSTDLEDEGRSIDALGAAIAAGTISADQVGRSAQRDLALRLRWGACR